MVMYLMYHATAVTLCVMSPRTSHRASGVKNIKMGRMHPLCDKSEEGSRGTAPWLLTCASPRLCMHVK